MLGGGSGAHERAAMRGKANGHSGRSPSAPIESVSRSSLASFRPAAARFRHIASAPPDPQIYESLVRRHRRPLPP